jgi:hypothetical protein
MCFEQREAEMSSGTMLRSLGIRDDSLEAKGAVSAPRMKTRVSILIPVFNEVDLINTVVRRVMDVRLGDGVETEIVIVDDGSDDGSAEAIQGLRLRCGREIKVVRHDRIAGKAQPSAPP